MKGRMLPGQGVLTIVPTYRKILYNWGVGGDPDLVNEEVFLSTYLKGRRVGSKESRYLM